MKWFENFIKNHSLKCCFSCANTVKVLKVLRLYISVVCYQTATSYINGIKRNNSG